MTYREAARIILNELTEEQKDSDITIYNEEIDEYFSVNCIGISDEENDKLDKNHPYFYFFS